MSSKYLDPVAQDDKISNDEIRRRLTNEFHIPCGPVTPSTRRVHLKRLQKLEKERINTSTLSNDDDNGLLDYSAAQMSDSSTVVNGKNGTDDVSHPPNNDFLVATDNQPVLDGNSSRTVKRNSPRRYSPRRKTSEEIDAINSFNEISKQMNNNKSKKNVINLEESVKKSKNIRHSIVKTVNLTDTSQKLDQYSSSESDEDNAIENTPPATSFLNSRIALPKIFNGEACKTPLTRPPIRRTIVDKHRSLLNYSDSESDNDDVRNDKLCKMLLSHRPGLGRAESSTNSRSFFAKISNFFRNLKKKFSSSADYSSGANFSSSNYISFGLLFFVVTFFCVIFSLYFYAKFTLNAKHTLDLNDYAFIEDKSKLVAPICSPINTLNNDCLQFESDRNPALTMVKEIKNYIDNSIYDHNCEKNKGVLPISDFSFKRAGVSKALEGKVHSSEGRDPSLKDKPLHYLFSRDFENAIKLIQLNPSWNIKLSSIGFDEKLTLDPNYTLQLPLRCNLWLLWRVHMLPIVFTSMTIFFSLAFYFYYRRSKRTASEEQNLVFELIEKSIELLQSPDEPRSMPVLHIRDSLLSPSERKSGKFKRIWNKVVNHMEKSESRVKVEFKKIDGEDFKAWKWIASNGTSGNYLLNETADPDLDGSLAVASQTQKISGVEWQGQAFVNVLASKSGSVNVRPNATDNPNSEPTTPDLYRNKNFQALTRFLKIRNIFEKEAQFLDPNWHKKIKNTILEKTAKTATDGKHDIVHIEIEDNPNEGLVYLKCATIGGATNVFHALHGWWCEKKLVSVKFLKEERYTLRFPQSKMACVPLQIEPIL